MPQYKCVNGEYIELTESELADRAADVEAADLDMGRVRSQRNSMLSASDWTQIGDARLGVHTAEQWQEYRTLLADIPQTYSRVSEVVWPEDPPAAKVTRKVTAGEAARQSSLDGGGTEEEAQTAYDTAYAATD